MSVVIVAVSTSYKRKERASLANAPASTVTTNGQRKPLAHTNAVYPQACHPSQSISFPFFTRVGPPGRLASLHLHPSYTCIPVLLFYQAVFCTSSNSAFTPSVATSVFHLDSDLFAVLVSSSPGPETPVTCATHNHL